MWVYTMYLCLKVRRVFVCYLQVEWLWGCQPCHLSATCTWQNTGVFKEIFPHLFAGAPGSGTWLDLESCDSLVWLDATNLHLPRPKKKLDDKRVGPFKILDKAGAAAYKLRLPPHWKIHSQFNKKLLMPYVPPAFLNQEQPPPLPPDLINNKEEFKIKEVLDSWPCTIHGWKGQKSWQVIDYFVKWKGWTREHNSWVRDEEMGNAQEAIKEYEEHAEERP